MTTRVRSSNLFGRAIFTFKSMTHASASTRDNRSGETGRVYVAFSLIKIAPSGSMIKRSWKTRRVPQTHRARNSNTLGLKFVVGRMGYAR